MKRFGLWWFMGQREIREGEVLPWGYGLAWDTWDRNGMIVMVWPLNHVAAWVRRVWYWARDARPGMHEEIELLRKQNALLRESLEAAHRKMWQVERTVNKRLGLFDSKVN